MPAVRCRDGLPGQRHAGNALALALLLELELLPKELAAVVAALDEVPREHGPEVLPLDLIRRCHAAENVAKM